jgi:hypothetical protein
VLETPPLVIPAGTILVQYLISVRGGMRLHLDRATLRKTSYVPTYQQQ